MEKNGKHSRESLNIAFTLQRREISQLRGDLPRFYRIFMRRKQQRGGIYYYKVTFHLGLTTGPGEVSSLIF